MKRGVLIGTGAAVLGGLAVAFAAVVARDVHGSSDGAATPSPVAVAEARPEGAELSFFEEKLVGGWSRYHRYDGSTQYVIFGADRTACKWEESASGGVTNEASFGHWELREWDTQPNVFSIFWGNGSDNLWNLYWFSYATDELAFGASNLIGSRARDLSGCFS